MSRSGRTIDQRRDNLREPAPLPSPHPFCRGNDRGATPIEYALIAAGIAVVVAGTVFALGGDVARLFDTLTDEVSEAAKGTADAPGSMGFDALVAAMEVTGPDQVRQKFDTYLALNGRAVQQEHARRVMRAARYIRCALGPRPCPHCARGARNPRAARARSPAAIQRDKNPAQMISGPVTRPAGYGRTPPRRPLPPGSVRSARRCLPTGPAGTTPPPTGRGCARADHKAAPVGISCSPIPG